MISEYSRLIVKMAENAPNDEFHTPRSHWSENSGTPRSVTGNSVSGNNGKKNANVQPVTLNFGKNTIPKPNEPLSQMKLTTSIPYDELPMKLVANARFIDYFYSCIVVTAKFIYNHYMHPEIKIPKELGEMIRFHYQDITMIGGAVITLLDHTLMNYKQRHHLQPIESVFQKGTSDIDMTWSMPTNPMLAGKYPQQLIFMGKKMVEMLQKGLNAGNFINEIKQIIQNMYSTDCDFRVEVEGRDHAVKYGSFSIVITFVVDDHPIKIGDLTLHDSYNSQRYNDFHQINPSPKTMPVIMDPIYCISSAASEYYSITQNTITLNPMTPTSVPIRIPTIDRFVYQQLFAAGNLLLDPSYQPTLKAKGYNHIRRVAYLLYLLHSFQKSNANNNHNIRKIGNLKDVSITKFHLFNSVVQKINMIIHLTRNASSKEAVEQKCIDAFSIVPNFYSELVTKLEREQIAQQADQLAQKARQAQQARQMYMAQSQMPMAQSQMPMAQSQRPMTSYPYNRRQIIQTSVSKSHTPLPKTPTKKGGSKTRRNKARRTIKSSRR